MMKVEIITDYKGKEKKVVEEIIKQSLITYKSLNFSKLEELSTKNFPEGAIIKVNYGKQTNSFIKIGIDEYNELYSDIHEHFMQNKPNESFMHKKIVTFKKSRSEK